MCLSLFLFHAASLSAQAYLATISGTVKDTSGGVVIGAQVTVTSAATNFVSTVPTGSDGTYVVPFLTPGTYSLKVTATGFAAEERPGIVLNASDKIIVDIALKPGAMTETVVVSGGAPLLDNGNATIGEVLDTKQATNVPNIGRNTFNLGELVAGAYSGNYMQTKASSVSQPYSGEASQMVVNGLGDFHQLLLDGVPDQAPERLSAVIYTDFVPSPEAVQEVSVQSALYDAQYGHSDGATINAVLRTGSNDWHGSAYYILQNTVMNANVFDRNAQSLPVSVSHWNQPGGVIDGPVWIPHVYNGRNKTYFMFSYERIQNNLPSPVEFKVPTALERSGDFSDLTGVTLYEPWSPISSNLRTTAFPNNYIGSATTSNGVSETPCINPGTGAACLNPIAVNMLAYIPLPNVAGATAGSNYNYVPSDDTVLDHYYSWAARIDEQFSQKEKLTGTVFRSLRNQVTATYGWCNSSAQCLAETGTPSGTPSPAAAPGYSHFRNDIGSTLDLISTLSPTLVLETRGGFLYHPFALNYLGNPFNLASLGYASSVVSAVPAQTFPGESISGSGLTYGGFSAGNAGQFSDATIYSFSEILSKAKGTHTIKAGFEFQGMRYNLYTSPINGFGSFSYNTQYTQQNYTTTNSSYGNAFADFLLGFPSSGSANYNIAPAYQQLYYGLYVQDDWRVLPKLTLNLGLRWDYEQPLTDRFNRMESGFCFNCANPVNIPNFPVSGGLQYVSPSSREGFHGDFGDWGPRIGIAYQAAKKLVIRGGFGVIYLPTVDPPGTLGFSANTSYVASNNGGQTPANSLTNPYPNGYVLPTGNTLGLQTLLGQDISFSDPTRVIPRLFMYTAGFEYQLAPDTALKINYVGSALRRWQVNKGIDALPLADLALGSAALTTQVTNPMYGYLPASSGLDTPTIAEWKLLEPYPEFGTTGTSDAGITENARSLGTFSYNSLQITLTKRISHGLSANANFTLAKVMDTNRYLDPQADWTQLLHYQDNQPNHLFGFSFTYALPIPKTANGVLNSLVGGWQFNGAGRWYNGALISNPSGATQLLSSVKTNDWSTYHTFNTCYITNTGVTKDPWNALSGGNPNATSCAPGDQPAWQQITSVQSQFGYSNLGPYMNIRNTVHPLFDVSLFKQFVVRERVNVELRGEFFNVFNTDNFGGPNTTLTSGNFGLVGCRTITTACTSRLSQANDPRIGQVTFRLNF
ncbi:MAG: TonB-dependent receptor domain-containing protein [Candidatus Acidiferrales bacterium]